MITTFIGVCRMFPFRTRQLGPPAPMVLTCTRVGRVGRCQD